MKPQVETHKSETGTHQYVAYVHLKVATDKRYQLDCWEHCFRGFCLASLVFHPVKYQLVRQTGSALFGMNIKLGLEF